MIESLLAHAREILSDDFVVHLDVSMGYMEKLQELTIKQHVPLLPFSFDPLLPPNTAVLRYKSGKVTMVYANGDLLEFPPLKLDDGVKLVDTST